MTYSLKRLLPLVLLLVFMCSSCATETTLNQDLSTAPALHNHQKPSEAAVCNPVKARLSLRCGQAPSATFDNKGRLWVAWAFDNHVYVNYSDDEGKTFSAPVAVNSSPETISARGENRAKIKVDGKGRVHVSWTKPLTKRFTGDIRYSRSDDGGRSFIAPVTVNDNRDPIGHRFDSLGVSDEGRVYIAWLDKRDRESAEQGGDSYSGAALYYSYAEPGVETFETNIKIADHSCECCRIALDIDPDGLPVLMWRHVYGDNIRDHALVRFLSPNKSDTPVRVSNDQWKIDACPHHGPALSISGDARYHAVWFNDAELKQGLFYAYSEDNGQSYSPPVNFGDYNKTAAHPYVMAVGNRVYLSWKEFDGKETQILVQQSNDGGNSWRLPKVVSSTSNASDHPLLIKNDRQVFLSWQTANEGYHVIAIEEESIQ